jgi:hypothetical protein
MVTKLPLPKGPSNQTGMGATPGTQQRAKRNLASGGGYNPNMPVGRQIAQQSASSYQQSKTPVGIPGMTPTAPSVRKLTPAMKQPPQVTSGQAATGRPVVTSGQAATGRPAVTQGAFDPTRGYNVLATMTPQEILETNKALGMSNLTQLERPKSMLLYSDMTEEELEAIEESQKQAEEEAEAEAEAEAEEKGVQAAADKVSEALKELDELEVSNEAGYQAKSAEEMQASLDDETSGLPGAPGSPTIKKPEVPETPDPYDGVDPTLGTENVQAIEDFVNKYLEKSGGNTIGLDQDKKKQAIELLDQKYATHLQQVLMGLDRQAAMAGTFGSAAHTMNINTAISGSLQQMASEYMNLEVKDMEAVEADYVQMFEEMKGVTQQFKDLETMAMDLEKLNQMAADLGIKHFTVAIQKFIAEGDIAALDLEKYGLDLQKFQALINQWGLEADTYTKLLGLEQDAAKLENELNQAGLGIATMFGEDVANYVSGLLGMIETQYEGADDEGYGSSIMVALGMAMSDVAGGKDSDEVAEWLLETLAKIAASLDTDQPG